MVEKMLPVSSLQKNIFNPNVMQQEEFQALKADMQRMDPDQLEPVIVSPYEIFYAVTEVPAGEAPFVIVDGEHRWSSAAEINWPEIRCDVRNIDEEEAKGLCYRKNKDRGSIDPFKEAALFKSEVDAGLNQSDIADKFLVDRTTVSHRLSLLKLVPEVREQIAKLPRGTVTPSHLEPIASLPEGEQKKVELVARWDNTRVRSVQDITDEVKRTKEQLAEQLALKQAVESAKFPKCPKCDKDPAGQSYGSKLPWVRCSSGSWEHSWNLDTGKLEHESVKVHESLDTKKEPQLSSVIRSNFTVKQLSDAFFNSIHAVLPDLDSASNISIRGTLKGEPFAVTFEHGPNGMRVDVSHGKGYRDSVYFSAEPKDYQSGHKSKIDVYSYPIKQEALDRCTAFIDNAFNNILLPLPDKSPAKKTSDAIAGNLPAVDNVGEVQVYCIICNNTLPDKLSVHYEHQIYCQYCAMICNLPGHEADDDCLNAKALKRREQLRSEGKVLSASMPAAAEEVPPS